MREARPVEPRDSAVLRDALLATLEREATGTRRLIAALPADRLEWRPHPMGTAALELAWHIVESEILLCEAIERGSFEGMQPADRPPSTVAEVIAHHERLLPSGIERLRGLPEGRWAAEARLLPPPRPLVGYLEFMVLHSIHHRGQLSAYLRAMGAFVPGVYGRSADERPPRP